jgi:hypothetical protein
VHGLLAEVVIDPEDRPLIEGLQQNLVQRPCRFEIDAEWLLDDDSGPVGAVRLSELLASNVAGYW